MPTPSASESALYEGLPRDEDIDHDSHAVEAVQHHIHVPDEDVQPPNLHHAAVSAPTRSGRKGTNPDLGILGEPHFKSF